MKNYTLTPSNSSYADSIIVKANSEEEVFTILKSYGWTDEDFTDDYSLSNYADCYIQPSVTNDTIEELSKDFNVVYVYEENRNYQVICGFEIENAEAIKNITYFNLDNLILYSKKLPKEFMKIILLKLNKELVDLESNKTYWEKLRSKINTMDKIEMSEYLSSNQIRKYEVTHLRVILNEEIEQKFGYIEKYISETQEKINYVKKEI
jgi:hypothetical protein